MKKSMTIALLLALGGLATACQPHLRRFPLAPPLWEDQDQNHVLDRPSKYYSGLMADGADQMFFRPISEFWYFDSEGESRNVNAIDEVPNSSWFTNRIGFFDVAPERAARGPCADVPDLDPALGKWKVVGAKPNGANPGFFIKAPDGHSYLLKFDGPKQPPRATIADVFGSKLYWLVGFNTPCNSVVYFPEDIFKMDPEATAENDVGEDVPMEKHHIDQVLGKAYRLKNGLLRASASRFVPGRPIGPFSYEGTRSDDPNDIIDHEDRRELRAGHLLAAWINHFDTREQNSLNVWVEEGGRSYVKHFIIDWGDSFGSRWPHDAISRRIGRSWYFDGQHVFEDFISLGMIPRDYNSAKLGRYGLFGYYDSETFSSKNWRPGYANPAFENMTPRDALWMIRILSRVTPEHIRAMIGSSKIPDPRHEAYLIKLLLERRQKIFEEYLNEFAPLTSFMVARRTKGDLRQSLCFEDLALLHNVVEPEDTRYQFRFRGGPDLETTEDGDKEELGWLEFTPDPDHPHRSCVLLPVGHRRPSDFVKENAAPNDPMRYGILDIFIHQSASVLPTSSMNLHFYDLGEKNGFQLVGIERPPKAVVPDLY